MEQRTKLIKKLKMEIALREARAASLIGRRARPKEIYAARENIGQLYDMLDVLEARDINDRAGR